jgi:hypothetical protein
MYLSVIGAPQERDLVTELGDCANARTILQWLTRHIDWLEAGLG